MREHTAFPSPLHRCSTNPCLALSRRRAAGQARIQVLTPHMLAMIHDGKAIEMCAPGLIVLGSDAVRSAATRGRARTHGDPARRGEDIDVVPAVLT